MEFILLGFVFIVILFNLGDVIALLKTAILKVTSKKLFFSAATSFSIYIITNAFVYKKSATETGVLEVIGSGIQNFFLSVYLYGGIVFLAWGVIRKGFEIKGIVKKD
ncbi:TPA: hypothetical protein OR231_003016 [Escherichia coli]|nr:hypothetical protein [Escherichia coli]